MIIGRKLLLWKAARLGSLSFQQRKEPHGHKTHRQLQQEGWFASIFIGAILAYRLRNRSKFRPKKRRSEVQGEMPCDLNRKDWLWQHLRESVSRYGMQNAGPNPLPSQDVQPSRPFNRLALRPVTAKALQILRLISKGLRNKQISLDAGIAQNTV